MRETPEALRSRTMRAVRSKDTQPEWIVRRQLHAAGYRYRLHVDELPGKPDLVFPGRSKLIFVHGCFWHGHHCKRGDRLPRTNTAYWTAKIKRNRDRDLRHAAMLRRHGWGVLIVWECQVRKPGIVKRMRRFLDHPSLRTVD